MSRLALLHHAPYERWGTEVQVRQLRGEGAPGERVALSFDIRAQERVPIVVEAHGPARDWLDVFVVKVWDQAGVGVYRGPPVTIPELLLKDDGVELSDTYGRFCGHLRHLHRLRRRPHYYRPPILRLEGSVTTTLEPGKRKQVWVTVVIPSRVAPRSYSAAVMVRGPDGETVSLEVSIAVLALRLREPAQDRMLWYRGTIDCGQPQHYLPEHVFRTQLADIHAHGFCTISLNEWRLPLLVRAAKIAEEEGFSSVVLQGGLKNAHNSQFGRLKPLVYVSDEIDQRGPEWYSHHQENMGAAVRAGLPTITSIVDAGFFGRLADLAPMPDIISLYLPKNLQYFHSYSLFPEMRKKRLYFYWMAHMEKPNVHRVLAGYYLWKSGAAGISPYCYQHLPVFPNSPYDDFDDWEAACVLGEDRADYKDHMATYPAADGVVPTLQWEGLAEGITDLRYLTTVERLLAETAPARGQVGGEAGDQAAAARQTLAEISDIISLRDIDIASDTNTEPYPEVTVADLANFRRRLAEHGVALTSITDRD